MKLITGAAALCHLGVGYRTTTEVHLLGKRLGGQWQGTLALVGSGDPLLSTPDLDALVAGLQANGLKRFAGTVVADESHFDSVRRGPGWMWDDAGTDDGPPISALTLNLAHLGLDIHPGAVGQPALVRPQPFTSYCTIQNQARTAATGDPVEAECRPVNGRDVIWVHGVIAPGSTGMHAEVTVTDPPRFAATQFAEAIGRSGIPTAVTVGGPGSGLGGTVVASHESAPLRDVVRAMQKDSVNLIAEMLLKQVGGQSGLPGTTAKGIATEQAWLTTIGWQPETFRLVDGSGLSRYNLVTPRQLVQLLTYMDGQPALSEAYRHSLPIAGVDGTLASRFRGLRDSRRLIAKTGTLSGVSSLSGYVDTADGEHLAFSLLVNGGVGSITPIRGAQDALISALADWQR